MKDHPMEQVSVNLIITRKVTELWPQVHNCKQGVSQKDKFLQLDNNQSLTFPWELTGLGPIRSTSWRETTHSMKLALFTPHSELMSRQKSQAKSWKQTKVWVHKLSRQIPKLWSSVSVSFSVDFQFSPHRRIEPNHSLAMCFNVKEAAEGFGNESWELFPKV